MDGKHLDASESVWGGAESTALMVMEKENESSGVSGSNEGYETMMMDGGASEHYLDNSARLGEGLSDYVRLEEPQTEWGCCQNPQPLHHRRHDH